MNKKPLDDLKERGDNSEFCYIDKDGRHCDEELWDEILGADDQNVIQLSGLSEFDRIRRDIVAKNIERANDSAVMHVSPGTIKHATFEESLRANIGVIQAAFAEHDPLSIAEWEDGFRRDATPEREVALWLRAAEVYEAFTVDEVSAERRRDIYRCLIACMVSTPETIWSVLGPETLTHQEAVAVIDVYFGGSDLEGPE